MTERVVIYPGTFDPITYGHLDVIERACTMFDRIVVAVAADSTKSSLFTVEERLAMADEAVSAAGLRAGVTLFRGLLADFVTEQGAVAVVRGLRAVSDFEFEFQLALMNRKLNDRFETIFLMPRDTYTYLSSSIVKEIARLGGPVGSFVPAVVENALKAKFAK